MVNPKAKALQILLAVSGTRQIDLAESIKVSAAQVSTWKSTGGMSEFNLKKVLGFFEISESEFLLLGEAGIKSIVQGLQLRQVSSTAPPFGVKDSED